MKQSPVFNALDRCIDGIIVAEPTGELLFINRTCVHILDLSISEIAGKNIAQILPGIEQINTVFLNGNEIAHEGRFIAKGIETKGLTASGSELPVEVTLSPMPCDGETLFLYILRDISKRREIEDQMDALQADMMHLARVSAVDEMGAALAHEINQPLTAAILYLSTLTRSTANGELDEKLRSLVDKAQKEAERASQIISRMRSFIEKRAPHKSEVSLNDIVDDAVELTLLGAQRVVDIVKIIPNDLPLVHADAVQIEQILVNLLRNAIEATRDTLTPRITITGQSDGNFVRIHVNDNGTGIPPLAVPDLFKAFASSKGNGLGVGLTISRSIAQNHGGDLTAHPGGEGVGATFTLLLPVTIHKPPS